MCRLKLKGKPFSMFTAASESSQELLWQELELIEESLKFGAKHQTKIFRSSKSLLPGSSLLFHDLRVLFVSLCEWQGTHT